MACKTEASAKVSIPSVHLFLGASLESHEATFASTNLNREASRSKKITASANIGPPVATCAVRGPLPFSPFLAANVGVKSFFFPGKAHMEHISKGV